jgi:hypothetical protein
MKNLKLLTLLFCFGVSMLNASTLPLPKQTFNFGVEKVGSCVYQILIVPIRKNIVTTVSVTVNGAPIPIGFVPSNISTSLTVTVNGLQPAIINATNCTIYISSPVAYYVLDFDPITNTLLTFNGDNCTISDDL